MKTTREEKRPKILVIDDDPSATKLMHKLLSSKGYQVITTNSSAEGLELAQNNSLDLVILDLLLPEMHGGEVCSKIKESNPLPILIISAMDSPEVKAKTLDQGADDYLTKPVTANILFARLEMLIRRYRYEQYALSPYLHS